MLGLAAGPWVSGRTGLGKRDSASIASFGDAPSGDGRLRPSVRPSLLHRQRIGPADCDARDRRLTTGSALALTHAGTPEASS